MFMHTYTHVQNSNKANKNHNSPNNMYGGGPVLGTFGNDEEDAVKNIYDMPTNRDTIESVYDTPTNGDTIESVYDTPTNVDTIESVYEMLTNEDTTLTNGHTIENICYELGPIKKSTNSFDTIEKDNTLDFEKEKI